MDAGTITVTIIAITVCIQQKSTHKIHLLNLKLSAKPVESEISK